MFTPTTSKVVFLVPRTLTWDKLCALYLWVLLHFPNRKFSSFSEVMDADLADIHFHGDENQPDNYVDVDAVHDYKATENGSATERVVEINPTLSELPGVNRMVELLNVNNTNGGLKSFLKSFLWLIRELFNVGGDNPSRNRRIKVIDDMWPAIEVYLAASAIDESTVENMKNPFTLDSFTALCRIAQVANTQVNHWVACYDELFLQARKKRDTAEQRTREIIPETFDVTQTRNGNGVGHFIVSDNTRLASEHLRAHREVAVLMTRRSSGNVAIFCGGAQNFDGLYAELNRAEPGLWYLEDRNPSPMLLNGSTTRSAPATKLTKAQLITLIQSNYQHRPR